MSNFTAVYDACVLYPAPLRDLLMQLALTDLYRARWTNDLHDEWIRNLLKNRQDLTLERLTRTKQLMNDKVRDCLVEGYQSLIPSLRLPDPNDSHVLAAAIRCQAAVIVTFNLKDFPLELLSIYDIEPQHPDLFILHLLDLSPAKVCKAAEICRNRLIKKPKTPEQYLGTLLQQGLPQTVASLRELYYET